MFALVPARFAQGLEEQRSLPKKRQGRGSYLCFSQKEAGKRLIPVLSCEGRLGSTPAVGAASPAPVGLREMSF